MINMGGTLCAILSEAEGNKKEGERTFMRKGGGRGRKRESTREREREKKRERDKTKPEIEIEKKVEACAAYNCQPLFNSISATTYIETHSTT